ncbi:hypothetical protein [Deinococcus sp. Leaf326]|uniref:hypothetical protein n=1 Tax=Deinococcus sp. Leaf326 TaxID=1736338 RepID=UPI0006F9618D|nr:hypothetical protein [Deinococcus sp. Leaf326]KQR07447.1 hypothetical protein ASF71_20950 [Deinococcus sp. Leaf326]
MTNDLFLTCALLLGGVTGATTARVAGAHPVVLILPAILVLGLAVMPLPESLLAAAGLTLLAVTISFCAFVHTPQDPHPALGGVPAFGLAALCFLLIALSPLIGGLSGLAFAALIGLTPGLLSRAQWTALPWVTPALLPGLLGMLTLLCFITGATLNLGAGALAAALFLLFALARPARHTPLTSPVKDLS